MVIPLNIKNKSAIIDVDDDGDDDNDNTIVIRYVLMCILHLLYANQWDL